MRKLLWVLSLVVLLFSCGDRDTVVMAKRAFPQEKKIRAVRIPAGETMNPGHMLQKGDYLIIESILSPKMLFVYSAPDLRFVCATGNKGNGPDEFPSIPFLIDSQTDSIYVFGYGLRYLKSMAVDSAAGVRLTERYALLFHEAFNSMHLLKDSVLVYQTVMPPQYSIKKYNLRQNEMIGELKMERESPQEELAWDLSRGKMAANDSVIVYVYLYKNQIDLYDLETMELKKRNVWEYKPQQPTFKDEELYYVSAFAGKKYFYALFKGERNAEGKNPSNTIEVYDYDGNPVALYRFDIPPLYFYPDEKNNCIYATHPSCMDTLLRYDL